MIVVGVTALTKNGYSVLSDKDGDVHAQLIWGICHASESRAVDWHAAEHAGPMMASMYLGFAAVPHAAEERGPHCARTARIVIPREHPPSTTATSRVVSGSKSSRALISSTARVIADMPCASTQLPVSGTIPRSLMVVGGPAAAAAPATTLNKDTKKTAASAARIRGWRSMAATAGNDAEEGLAREKPIQPFTFASLGFTNTLQHFQSKEDGPRLVADPPQARHGRRRLACRHHLRS